MGVACLGQGGVPAAVLHLVKRKLLRLLPLPGQNGVCGVEQVGVLCAAPQRSGGDGKHLQHRRSQLCRASSRAGYFLPAAGGGGGGRPCKGRRRDRGLRDPPGGGVRTPGAGVCVSCHAREGRWHRTLLLGAIKGPRLLCTGWGDSVVPLQRCPRGGGEGKTPRRQAAARNTGARRGLGAGSVSSPAATDVGPATSAQASDTEAAQSTPCPAACTSLPTGSERGGGGGGTATHIPCYVLTSCYCCVLLLLQLLFHLRWLRVSACTAGRAAPRARVQGRNAGDGWSRLQRRGWASRATWVPRRPMGSWGALGGAWPAGRGRFSSPSALPHLETVSSSGLPSSRKMRSYWRESSGGLRG